MKYIAPEFEAIELATSDIILASSGTTEQSKPVIVPGGGIQTPDEEL